MSTYSFHRTIGQNPATLLTAGQSCELYLATRFALPATNAAVPDGLPADYTGLTTDNVVDPIVSGVEATVNDYKDFYVRYWDALTPDTTNGGTFNTYWVD